jgi:hypothetical protein
MTIFTYDKKYDQSLIDKDYKYGKILNVIIPDYDNLVISTIILHREEIEKT